MLRQFRKHSVDSLSYNSNSRTRVPHWSPGLRFGRGAASSTHAQQAFLFISLVGWLVAFRFILVSFINEANKSSSDRWDVRNFIVELSPLSYTVLPPYLGNCG